MLGLCLLLWPVFSVSSWFFAAPLAVPCLSASLRPPPSLDFPSSVFPSLLQSLWTVLSSTKQKSLCSFYFIFSVSLLNPYSSSSHWPPLPDRTLTFESPPLLLPPFFVQVPALYPLMLSDRPPCLFCFPIGGSSLWGCLLCFLPWIRCSLSKPLLFIGVIHCVLVWCWKSRLWIRLFFSELLVSVSPTIPPLPPLFVSCTPSSPLFAEVLLCVSVMGNRDLEFYW